MVILTEPNIVGFQEFMDGVHVGRKKNGVKRFYGGALKLVSAVHMQKDLKQVS
ncbi:hypothetical protein WN943_008701 [Citrus x changshan-huyou]